MATATLPPFDEAIQDIANYVYNFQVGDSRVWQCAQTALLDALGCAMETLHKNADVRNMIGPWIAGSQVPNGFRLPGTSYVLDPVKGAFSLGVMIRYLDHNDAMVGKEWGHPSGNLIDVLVVEPFANTTHADNIGSILPVMDWLCREEASGNRRRTGPSLTVRTLLEAIVKAYEIQGCMLLQNAFNEHALDHTVLVKLASASVVPWLMGLSKEQAMACISHVWMDSAASRVYRHGSNTIPRKGWAGGDACSRAVQFALMVRSGQPGAPTVLTMPRWGFYASTWRGKGEFVLPLAYGEWVIQNNFYKVMPVEAHGIAPVEAALRQLNKMQARGLLRPVQDISKIVIRTNAATKTIIDKPDKLYNYADRDHCVQYVVAVSLLKGSPPEATDYNDDSSFAGSRDVEALTAKMEVNVDNGLTADYLDVKKKSIAAGLTFYLTDGSVLEEVLVEFPIGHVTRPETMRHVQQKFRRNMLPLFSDAEAIAIQQAVRSNDQLPVSALVDMFAKDRAKL